MYYFYSFFYFIQTFFLVIKNILDYCVKPKSGDTMTTVISDTIFMIIIISLANADQLITV